MRAPTSTPLRYPGAGPIQFLVFANRVDGYAIENATSAVGGPPGGPILATDNGGRSWHRFSFGPHLYVSDMAASESTFYVVLFRCTERLKGGRTTDCGDFRLARSAAGSKKWSSVPIPGNPLLSGFPVRLGVEGLAVWLSFQSLSNGTSYPHLLESTGGAAPFADTPTPHLGGVTACGVTPMAGGAMWAECPTGLLISYLHREIGQHFRPVLTVGGTIGAAFDPVNAETAFAYLGTDSRKLEETTNGGVDFVTVSQPPFYAAYQLLFVNQTDGFALGTVALSQRAAERPELLQTVDGGTSWTRVSF